MIMKREAIISFAIAVLVWEKSQACFHESIEREMIYEKTGTPYYLECTCNEPGYDTRHITWLDNNDTVVREQRPGIEHSVFTVTDHHTVSLNIPYLSKKTSGTYKCQTNFEGNKYIQTYHITAYDPITINPPVKQFLLLGNRSLIRCEVHAEPDANLIVTWHKVEGDRLVQINTDATYTIMPEGLYINKVEEKDKGIYSCAVLESKTMDEVDINIYTEIITKPVIKGVKAVPESTVVVGDRLVLECDAEGTPHPEYIWRKVDEPVTENPPRWKQQINALVMESILPQDSGVYECVAQSNAGVVSETIDIQVLVPPSITSFENITAKEGSTVQLVCNAEGRPAPNVSIIFIDNDLDLVELDDNDIKQNLEFIKVNRSDMGVYACNATNKVDYATRLMFLSVEFKPYFKSVAEVVWGWKGHEVNLSCEYESNPPAELSWRYEGKGVSTAEQVQVNKLLNDMVRDTYIRFNVSAYPYPFGVYECKAANALGADKKTITFKEGFVPGNISDAAVLIRNPTSVTFDIRGPDTIEGPAILGYTAEYDTEFNSNVTDIHMNRTWAIDRPYTIENLEPNTTYVIRFAALNEVGQGPWTEYKTFYTLEPSIPSPPQWQTVSDGELVNITSMDQTTSWNPAEGNGATVNYYTVRYCPVDDEESCMEDIIEPNSELKLNNRLLEFNTTYSIEVMAHNYMGDSVPANLTVLMTVDLITAAPLLSAGAIIGISVVMVFVCLLFLDLLLLMWRKQGIIASCCIRKKKKKSKADEGLRVRDKKGLLRDTREADEAERHKEFEYNKTTGIITGRHSAV